MSEPPSFPSDPPAAAPFAPRPLESRGGGCSKPALIGCGALFLLLGVAGLVFVFNAKSLLNWSLGKMEPAILANLNPDVTEADRERFVAAFAASRAAIDSGKLDPAALQALQRELLKAVQQPKGTVSREEILALTLALERVAGIGSAEEPAGEAPSDSEPTPEPAAEPEPASSNIV